MTSRAALARTTALHLALALLLMAHAPAAGAWVLIGPDWSGDDVTMSLNAGATWDPTAEDAMFRWNDAPANSWAFFFNTTNQNRCDRGTACIGTGGNAIEWENFADGVCSDASSGALAVTRLNWIIDFCNADVLFNNQYSWTTSDRECTTGSPYNFSSVAIHEFGHTLGLEHEDDELATMNAIYHANDHRIHGDDHAGMRALYPSGSSVNVMASHWERTSTSSSVAANTVEAPASPVTAGNSVTYEWTQENAGTSTATFNIGFYLSTNSTISTGDTLLGTNSGAFSSAGASFTGTRSLTIPYDTASGTYWIGAVLDYDGALSESSESDNDFEPCVSTVVNGGPDLDITSFNSPEPVVPGLSYSLSSTVKNIGGDPTGTVRVGFYLSTNNICSTGDTFLGSRTVSLSKGASSTANTTVTIPAGTPASTRWVCAIADDQSVASELNESNNTASDQVAVVECTSSTQCNDGLFCNGTEFCSANTCISGTPPSCNDGISCTTDICSEAGAGSCLHLPSNAVCDDGLFCTGTEICSVVSGCVSGTPVTCGDGVSCTRDSCNETTNSCQNIADSGLCDDGKICNGIETCDAKLDCQAGAPVICDDGVNCTDDACDPQTGKCLVRANDSRCDDGLFCNGDETCDPQLDCQAASALPCGPGQTCDEGADQCVTPIAFCDVDMSQLVYTQGDTVEMTVLRYVNLSGGLLPTRLRLQIMLPPAIPVTINALDLNLTMPAGLDVNLGPVSMFPVGNQPPGIYGIRCALEDPGTGDVQWEDIESFEIQ